MKPPSETETPAAEKEVVPPVEGGSEVGEATAGRACSRGRSPDGGRSSDRGRSPDRGRASEVS